MFVYACARLRLCYGHVTDLVTYYGAKHPSCLHPETAGPLRQAVLQPVALSSCPPAFSSTGPKSSCNSSQGTPGFFGWGSWVMFYTFYNTYLATKAMIFPLTSHWIPILSSVAWPSLRKLISLFNTGLEIWIYGTRPHTSLRQAVIHRKSNSSVLKMNLENVWSIKWYNWHVLKWHFITDSTYRVLDLPQNCQQCM